jgi:hypothetical protein
LAQEGFFLRSLGVTRKLYPVIIFDLVIPIKAVKTPIPIFIAILRFWSFVDYALSDISMSEGKNYPVDKSHSKGTGRVCQILDFL